MVSTVEQTIFECIDKKQSFILEAGAGSGKTWTLVQSLIYIIEKYKSQYKKQNKKIACITYTNVAKEEIIERIQANELVEVKTIHELLWELISPFSREIKNELILYIQVKLAKAEKEIRGKKRKDTQVYRNLEETIIRYTKSLEELKEHSGKIEYRERPYWNKGIISHDEVIYIANNVIKNFSVMRKLIQDMYPVIFVDEYQDTDRNIAETILEFLIPNTSVLFGFFGDFLQQIYGGSIGKIDAGKYGLKIITKEENYRCSQEVIQLLNKLREDIQQIQTGEKKTGKCLFYYVNNTDFDSESFIERIVKKDLDLLETSEVKKLYLVTRTIAQKNDYIVLHDLYDEKKKSETHSFKTKDQILKNQNNRGCPYANYLHDIKNIIELYKTDKTQQLLKNVSYDIMNTRDKIELKINLDNLCKKIEKDTIKEIFVFVSQKKILDMPEKLKIEFEDFENGDVFFQSLMNLKFKQFKNLYTINQETSPFSTNHGTKGAEFDNVVCIINDKDWNQYSVNNFFDGSDLGKSRFDRTRNLFYVMCSRAKYNLAIIFLSELSESAFTKVQETFGSTNVIRVTT